MGRLLAIDYGGKRCGIAVTDLDQVFAFGHDTVSTSDLLDYLKDYTQKENVEGIIVGMHTNYNPLNILFLCVIFEIIQQIRGRNRIVAKGKHLIQIGDCNPTSFTPIIYR